jgi:threonine dehydratase
MTKTSLIGQIDQAYGRVARVVLRTPLQLNSRLSEKYQAKVYLKREDLQVVRSYKLRGAYNAIVSLTKDDRLRGVVCASAGNHAQGVAFSCAKLHVRGYIFMPKNTPKQKVNQVVAFGGEWVEIRLVGETYDDTYTQAKEFCSFGKKVFVHPFDDQAVIVGQGTLGVELLEQIKGPIDYLVVPVGGGGLVAGVGTYLKTKQPTVTIVGVEPAGAASMTAALKSGKPVTLNSIEKFVDGAAVKTVGEKTFALAKDCLDSILTVPEGHICQEMVDLYQSDGIITEPAGALSVSALEQLRERVAGKTVVCVVSGGNNDISRYPEVMERALIHRGLKHYFLIEFSQRPGALREYLDTILGKNDDITLFEYVKKSNKETGPALVGVELLYKEDLEPLLSRMNTCDFSYERVEKNSPLFRFLL